MALMTATSVLVTALLATPTAEGFAPTVVPMCDVSVATTTVPDQQSMGPDFSRGEAKKLPFSRYDSIQPITCTTNRPRQRQQRCRVPTPSRFRYGVDRAPDVANDVGVPLKPGPFDAADALSDADMLSPTHVAGQLSDSLQWTSTSDSPWRERARKGRLTVASSQENTEDSEDVLGVAGHVNWEYLSMDVRERRRTIARSEARAIRKQTSDRKRHANAEPLMDLVGVTAPLAFIIGFAVVESLT